MSSNDRAVPTLVITGAHPKLYNHDLAPTAPAGRTWGVFSLFAMWMSDVHSVGGYTFAASLFFLGLTGWQVLISMVVGIIVVYFLMNLIGRPSLRYGIPYPVVARISFGVMGANLAAVVRGVVGIVWYGVQTYFASKAVQVLVVTLLPVGGRPDPQQHRRPVDARLVQLPVHVVLPARHFPQRHGAHPPVHRFLRPGGLRRDVRAGDLDAVADRLLQPVAAAQPAGADRRRDHRRDGERRDADRRLLCRAAAEFRRFRPLRQGRGGHEDGQLPRPAGEFPGVLDHHRDRHRGHAEGVRPGDHGPGADRRADRQSGRGRSSAR